MSSAQSITLVRLLYECPAWCYNPGSGFEYGSWMGSSETSKSCLPFTCTLLHASITNPLKLTVKVGDE